MNKSKFQNRLDFSQGHAFEERLTKLVPGGAHTYSRGADQFPRNAPNGFTRGQGCYVWDADGNCLVDWGMALASVSLGHAHENVNRAVIEAIGNGVNFTRATRLELEAAERFAAVTGTDMVKFAKHGSVVNTAAVKLARAYTGRTKVAVPKEHPFFSFDDWFIVTTEVDFGIPDELRNFCVQFSYNDLTSLEALFAQHKGEIACVMLEPVKIDAPHPGFLEGIRALCDREGAVLIFDEMVSGLKWAVPGAGSYFGVTPDISTWGKGIANGFSCAALAGRREIMRMGGIEDEGSRKLFLLSTTHGAEATGLAAMIATIDAFTSSDIVGKNWRTGERLRTRLTEVIARRGLAEHIGIVGYPCVMALTVRGRGEPDLAFRTLFIQEVIRCGILFQGVFVVTPSHGDGEIERTADAFDHACSVFNQALAANGVADLLDGPAVKPVFRKFI